MFDSEGSEIKMFLFVFVDWKIGKLNVIFIVIVLFLFSLCNLL